MKATLSELNKQQFLHSDSLTKERGGMGGSSKEEGSEECKSARLAQAHKCSVPGKTAHQDKIDCTGTGLTQGRE